MRIRGFMDSVFGIGELRKIEWRLRIIMATLQELKDVLGTLVTEVTDMRTSVDADVEQTSLVITAANALIEAINNSGSTDFTEEIASVAAAITGLQEARTKLASDNADVQAAIDAAGSVVPPPPPPPEA